jgi:hypothetical protein
MCTGFVFPESCAIVLSEEIRPTTNGGRSLVMAYAHFCIRMLVSDWLAEFGCHLCFLRDQTNNKWRKIRYPITHDDYVHFCIRMLVSDWLAEFGRHHCFWREKTNKKWREIRYTIQSWWLNLFFVSCCLSLIGWRTLGAILLTWETWPTTDGGRLDIHSLMMIMHIYVSVCLSKDVSFFTHYYSHNVYSEKSKFKFRS